MALPGPKFDEILGGQINSSVEAEVAFSPDGKRYAYCGRLGGEMVVMVDGKEFLRSSESNMGRFDGSSSSSDSHRTASTCSCSAAG